MGSEITLRLLIDAGRNKVLFGEADKNFVDFLFSFLTLPLGSVISFLSPQTMFGSIGKLYQSVENLNESCFVAKKLSLLHPNASDFDAATPLLRSKEWYLDQPILKALVKDMIYMITDELEVTPTSAISSITLINRLKDVKLEEKVVAAGVEEGLALLKASLVSSTVVTDVFCSSIPSHSAKVEV